MENIYSMVSFLCLFLIVFCLVLFWFEAFLRGFSGFFVHLGFVLVLAFWGKFMCF